MVDAVAHVVGVVAGDGAGEPDEFVAGEPGAQNDVAGLVDAAGVRVPPDVIDVPQLEGGAVTDDDLFADRDAADVPGCFGGAVEPVNLRGGRAVHEALLSEQRLRLDHVVFGDVVVHHDLHRFRVQLDVGVSRG